MCARATGACGSKRDTSPILGWVKYDEISFRNASIFSLGSGAELTLVSPGWRGSLALPANDTGTGPEWKKSRKPSHSRNSGAPFSGRKTLMGLSIRLNVLAAVLSFGFLAAVVFGMV